VPIYKSYPQVRGLIPTANYIPFSDGSSLVTDAAIQWDNSLKIFTLNGGATFNGGQGDFDFTVKKNTSGDAIKYDAGTDKLTLSGGFVSDSFKYLDADTGGSANLFVGESVALGNTGNQNVYIGKQSGFNNVGGYDNVGIGQATLYNASSSYRNVAIGTQALLALTSGVQNTGVGFNALTAVTLGNSNFGAGSGAGKRITTGSFNLAIGTDSLSKITTTNGNIALGSLSLERSTTAQYSVCIGNEAGRIDPTMGANNVMIGRETGWNTSSSANNTFIGAFSGKNCTGSSNVFIGVSSGLSETNSNRLYISNSDTSSPLIYGEFDNSLIKINGRLRITDNVATAVAGDLRYNSTTNKHQGYDGTTWNDMY